jgi:hypothetical protein
MTDLSRIHDPEDRDARDRLAEQYPLEIRETIRHALVEYARQCDRSARSRVLAGPHLKARRAELRAEARRCRDIAKMLGYVDPDALSQALGTPPPSVELARPADPFAGIPNASDEQNGRI